MLSRLTGRFRGDEGVGLYIYIDESVIENGMDGFDVIKWMRVVCMV